MVIGVGSNSQWGKIKATLVGDVENTPLQDKLEAMTGQVLKSLRYYYSTVQTSISHF